MARKKMVTRTIIQNTCEVMCVNVESADVMTITYKIGGDISAKEALEKLQKMYNTNGLKLVHMESMIQEELLLGMEEDEFIRLAKVLPSRTNTGKDAE